MHATCIDMHCGSSKVLCKDCVPDWSPSHIQSSWVCPHLNATTNMHYSDSRCAHIQQMCIIWVECHEQCLYCCLCRCSSGYNLAKYPQDMQLCKGIPLRKLNTQVAEQCNSLLDRIRTQVGKSRDIMIAGVTELGVEIVVDLAQSIP
jgi:hypothetical protein